MNSDILDSVLPEYERISQAVSPTPEKRYKSIDNLGNIWLIVHPSCWEWRYKNQDGTRNLMTEAKGIFNTRVRPKPELAMSAVEVKKIFAKTSIKERAKSSDGWS